MNPELIHALARLLEAAKQTPALPAVAKCVEVIVTPQVKS